MVSSIAISDELQSLQSNSYVQDLLSTLDAHTRDSVLALLSSLEEDTLEGVMEAIEQLDQRDASVDSLVAILKGRHTSVELDDRCRQSLHALYLAAKQRISRS
ncbi:MAG: hypothetical protein U1E05_00040 [Patescibacteria group bacterium]|nr:hypothetical protein [Patescibacteria group bacterium]